eukprot:CAMPEP_0178458308 /NCGR_PEP_ID=MMETSP0689_2-20121128/47480_1 /TAXON_ID=160604 /ORGANISM="Amphidinium massartii, Strain CS-259" /LENGTH=512 /DNA_ID=CAMNT_0020084615 /DNA_START=41 /DNA_END=1576 /DNA_ORIENTATION=-
MMPEMHVNSEDWQQPQGWVQSVPVSNPVVVYCAFENHTAAPLVNSVEDAPLAWTSNAPAAIAQPTPGPYFVTPAADYVRSQNRNETHIHEASWAPESLTLISVPQFVAQPLAVDQSQGQRSNADGTAARLSSQAEDFHYGGIRENRQQWWPAVSSDTGPHVPEVHAPQSLDAPVIHSGRIQGSSRSSTNAAAVQAQKRIMKKMEEDKILAELQEDDDPDMELRFKPAAAAFSAAAQSLSTQEERNLVGELLFMRSWPLLQGLGIEDVQKNCGKVVGMLLKLSASEQDELLLNTKKLQAKVRSCLVRLEVPFPRQGSSQKAADTGEGEPSQENSTASSSADQKCPDPPPERQGDMLYVAVVRYVADARLAMKVTGMLHSATKTDATSTVKMLLDEKKLRNAVNTALQKLSKDQQEEKEGRQRLVDFQAVPREQRAEMFRTAADTAPAAEKGASRSAAAATRAYGGARTKASDLLRLALRFLQQPLTRLRVKGSDGLVDAAIPLNQATFDLLAA